MHRDLKPHNVLLSNQLSVVKVADFGLSGALATLSMNVSGPSNVSECLLRVRVCACDSPAHSGTRSLLILLIFNPLAPSPFPPVKR